MPYELYEEILRSYIHQMDYDMSQLKPFPFNWEFQEASCNKWVAEETLERMKQWPERDPLDILYDFSYELCELDSIDSSHPFEFSTAYEASITLLDEFNFYLREWENEDNESENAESSVA